MGNKGHHRGKADSVEWLEGSNPGDVKAMSIGIPPGSYEQGMYLKGQLGNLGEPTVSLQWNKV